MDKKYFSEEFRKLINKDMNDYWLYVSEGWEKYDLKSNFEEYCLIESQLRDYAEDDISRVAMLGPVNAGKSTLGNAILNVGESEVFQEGDVRETVNAMAVKFEQNIELVDLPGLGSIIEEDETHSIEYLERASIVLLVLPVEYPITKNVYEFLERNFDKEGKRHKLILVLTKTDLWNGLTEAEMLAEKRSYLEFLLSGNEKHEFAGIQTLFNYEIPVIDVSVSNVRAGKGADKMLELISLIRRQLEGLSDSGFLRYLYGARQELENMRRAFIASFNQANKEYSDYLEKFTELSKLLMVEKENYNVRSSNIIAEQFELFAAIAGKQEIGIMESMFHNSSWEAKRERFKEERGKHEKRVFELLSDALDSYTEVVDRTYSDVFPDYECDPVIDSDKLEKNVKKLCEHVHSIFYKLWDYVDDVKYYEKNRDIDSVFEEIDAFNSKASEELEDIASHIWRGYPQALTTSDLYRLLKVERHEPLDQFSDQLIELTDRIDNKISEAL